MFHVLSNTSVGTSLLEFVWFVLWRSTRHEEKLAHLSCFGVLYRHFIFWNMFFVSVFWRALFLVTVFLCLFFFLSSIVSARSWSFQGLSSVILKFSANIGDVTAPFFSQDKLCLCPLLLREQSSKLDRADFRYVSCVLIWSDFDPFYMEADVRSQR